MTPLFHLLFVAVLDMMSSGIRAQQLPAHDNSELLKQPKSGEIQSRGLGATFTSIQYHPDLANLGLVCEDLVT